MWADMLARILRREPSSSTVPPDTIESIERIAQHVERAHRRLSALGVENTEETERLKLELEAARLKALDIAADLRNVKGRGGGR